MREEEVSKTAEFRAYESCPGFMCKEKRYVLESVISCAVMQIIENILCSGKQKCSIYIITTELCF